MNHDDALLAEQARAVRQMFERILQRATGMRLDEISTSRVVMHLPMEAELVGNFVHGILHGGVIASLLDVAGGAMAMLGAFDKHRHLTMQERAARLSRLGTIDLRIDYLRPGRGTRFTASATLLRSGNKVAVVRSGAAQRIGHADRRGHRHLSLRLNGRWEIGGRGALSYTLPNMAMSHHLHEAGRPTVRVPPRVQTAVFRPARRRVALLGHSHDPMLVVLSYRQRRAAATALAKRVSRSSNPRGRELWRWVGAFATGGGIWSMHFIGMLAFRAPLDIRYEHGITALSLLIAVAVSYVVMRVLGRDHLSVAQYATAEPLPASALRRCTTPGWPRFARWPRCTMRRWRLPPRC